MVEAGRPARAVPPRAIGALLLAAGVAFAWLAVAVAGGGCVVRADVRVARWVAATMPGWAEWTARAFSAAGSLAGLAVVTAGAVVVLVGRRRLLDAALAVAALAGSQLLVDVLKIAFARPRPAAGSPIPLPDSFSFPSGHAASAVAVLGTVAVLVTGDCTRRTRAAAVSGALAVAGCIGASRVVLDVHYPSDVAAGFAVGLAVLSACLLVQACTAGARARRERGRPSATSRVASPAPRG